MPPSLLDPPLSSPIGASVAFVHASALGSLATVVAVLAVVSLGYAMLAGRVPVRRAAIVLIGCFIIFGATAIARTLTALGGEPHSTVPAMPTSADPLPTPQVAASPYDPYAGASVPVVR